MSSTTQVGLMEKGIYKHNILQVSCFPSELTTFTKIHCAFFFSHCALFFLPIQTVKECWWERSCGHDKSTFKPWRPLGKANSRVFCWSPPSAWWPSLLRNPIFFSCLSEMCLGRRGGWKEVNSLNRVRTTNSVSEWIRISYNQRDRSSLMLQKNIASYLHLLSGDFIRS